MNEQLPTVRQIIYNEYDQGKNFMTPYVYKTGWIVKDCPGLVYELSEGEGFLSKDNIYGVTIVEITNINPIKTNRRIGLSKCCHSVREVNEYLEYLKETSPAMYRPTPLP